MTCIKNALARARPEPDIFDTRADRSGVVLLAVLALIFAPIIAAHLISLNEGAAAPAAIERPAR